MRLGLEGHNTATKAGTQGQHHKGQLITDTPHGVGDKHTQWQHQMGCNLKETPAKWQHQDGINRHNGKTKGVLGT